MPKLLRQTPKRATFKVRARLGHQRPEVAGEDAAGPRVTDNERFANGRGVRAYVGLVFDRDLAEEGISEGGWRPLVEVSEIPQTAEYLQHIAHGDLWPGDEETARLANGYALPQGLPAVKFDATYGGELEELKAWLASRDAKPALVKLASKTTSSSEGKV
jgi:hypothetical protein